MARAKKSRSLKGKLGKTGSKEQLKEQRKAQKASSVRAFAVKKAKQRKLQAAKKMERLGTAKVEEPKVVMQRPRRFTYQPPVSESDSLIDDVAIGSESDEITTNDLLAALTEQQ